MADLDGLFFVMRGKDDAVLDHPTVQARLHLPPHAHFSRPESTLVRTLYDCPDVPVGPEGCRCRVVVATHLATEKKSRIGRTRKGVVYELFFTLLPQDGFTASDVVALDLHRGAFEPLLADEDQEIDPDRWCSHSPAGQAVWQIVSQWIWNVRLELGHLLHPDGTLRCPANQSLVVHERRKEADGSLRVVYAASIRSCRPCLLRDQWQWNGSATAKPRQVSVLLHPLVFGSAPLLWRDWSRRYHRRACIQLLRHQCVEVQVGPPTSAGLAVKSAPLSRAQRAHYRLSWAERQARNARPRSAGQVMIRLCGGTFGFATSLGFAIAYYRLDSRWVPSSRTSLLLRVELHGLFS